VTLSTVSFVVVLGSCEEPFVVFRWSQALVQVGLAVALMGFWIWFAVGVSHGAAVRKVSR
jgi:hypothetical protein